MADNTVNINGCELTVMDARILVSMLASQEFSVLRKILENEKAAAIERLIARGFSERDADYQRGIAHLCDFILGIEDVTNTEIQEYIKRASESR